jgi:hypothetical protein
VVDTRTGQKGILYEVRFPVCELLCVPILWLREAAIIVAKFETAPGLGLLSQHFRIVRLARSRAALPDAGRDDTNRLHRGVVRRVRGNASA